jgi:hypothetical protein
MFIANSLSPFGGKAIDPFPWKANLNSPGRFLIPQPNPSMLKQGMLPSAMTFLSSPEKFGISRTDKTIGLIDPSDQSV